MTWAWPVTWRSVQDRGNPSARVFRAAAGGSFTVAPGYAGGVTVAYDEAVPRDARVAALYEELIAGWNAQDADRYAAPFADDGVVIGFDGSEMEGRGAIADEMRRIFADHETADYVAKVRCVSALGSDAAVLRAVVGMIPPGGSEVLGERHAHQTVVAVGDRIVLFQNTPAQYHGRPEVVERLTSELQAVADGG
jgi:uncharacterized protein (TIGR02246 family)